MDFRQSLFKYRSYTPIPFLLFMIFFASPTITNLVFGFLFVLVGEFMRLWGVAIAGSETRTTGPVGGTFLITKGPFSFVRNPLYLGNILMYFGIGVMSNVLLLAFVALLYFLFQYSMIVSLEEEFLLKKFGDKYIQYYQSVPRFIPTFKKYNSGNDRQPKFSWKSGLKSEKRTLQAICLITILLVVLLYFRG